MTQPKSESKKRLLPIFGAGLFICVILLLFKSRSSPLRPDPTVAPHQGEIVDAVNPVQSSKAATVPTPQIPSAAQPSLPPDPVTEHQLHVLDEILQSKNDNDPRMDTELKVLSENAKAKLRAKYLNSPPENRNDRGTIVFLLGRNLSSPADFEFFKEVVRETPCLSLVNCAKEPSHEVIREQEEHQNGMGISLAYPQLVALKAVARALQSGDSTGQAAIVIEEARHSRVAEVSKLADKIAAQRAQ